MTSTSASVLNSTTSKPITQSLLDKESLAKRLGLSVRTLENIVKDGGLPAGVRVGRYLYWAAEVVTVWEEHRFGAQKSWRP